ncbi:RING finger protein 151 isoform X2 [Lepisosteus oculatus]
MSGGYDVEQFVETPDPDLVCTICRGVLRCPVRVACNHVFCKSCILQWLKRQESCPCCRKPVTASMMFVMYKLSKSISRLRVKCGNEASGCAATFPLADQHCHRSGCPFEPSACPHEGCGAQLPRRDLPAHALRCPHRREPCPLGCGEVLSRQSQAGHNCYQQLRRACAAQRQAHRAIVATLQRKMRKMQSTMEQMKRQVALICESLEVADDGEEPAGEGSSSAGS